MHVLIAMQGLSLSKEMVFFAALGLVRFFNMMLDTAVWFLTRVRVKFLL